MRPSISSEMTNRPVAVCAGGTATRKLPEGDGLSGWATAAGSPLIQSRASGLTPQNQPSASKASVTSCLLQLSGSLTSLRKRATASSGSPMVAKAPRRTVFHSPAGSLPSVAQVSGSASPVAQLQPSTNGIRFSGCSTVASRTSRGSSFSTGCQRRARTLNQSRAPSARSAQGAARTRACIACICTPGIVSQPSAWLAATCGCPRAERSRRAGAAACRSRTSKAPGLAFGSIWVTSQAS